MTAGLKKNNHLTIMKQKEQWINETLNSLDGIKRPEVNPYLYTRIVERVHSYRQQTVPTRMIWITACALFCITVFNIFVLGVWLPKKERDMELRQLSSELIHTNTLNYN